MTAALPLAAFVISASPVVPGPSLAREGYLRAPPKARGDRTNDVQETTRAHAVDYDTMGPRTLIVRSGGTRDTVEKKGSFFRRRSLIHTTESQGTIVSPFSNYI